MAALMITTLRVLACGSLASMAAALALAASSKARGRSAAAPINATSHWMHGDSAANRDMMDVPHTGVGYATHHAAAVLWAGLFEVLRRRSTPTDMGAVARDAAVAATTAAVVDYVFTPHRLTPGWELVLPPRSMALAYIAMAAAFAGSELLLPKRQRQLA
jgi:hypothetical protein